MESNQLAHYENRFTVCRTPPTVPFLHVLIVTLSIDYVNTISGSVGKCVLKHVDDISALIAWCGTNML